MIVFFQWLGRRNWWCGFYNYCKWRALECLIKSGQCFCSFRISDVSKKTHLMFCSSKLVLWCCMSWSEEYSIWLCIVLLTCLLCVKWFFFFVPEKLVFWEWCRHLSGEQYQIMVLIDAQCLLPLCSIDAFLEYSSHIALLYQCSSHHVAKVLTVLVIEPANLSDNRYKSRIPMYSSF